MARDEAYRKAEQKIEEARRSGAKVLDLSVRYDAKDEDKFAELPESLGQLTQLQTLNLSRNQLTALPEWLGQLKQLQSVDLSRNQLTALPECLGQLTQLQSLYLSGNQLTALPESFGLFLNLEELNLAHNELVFLPDSIGELKRLKVLQLNSNPLASLPDTIRNCVSLERLVLMSVTSISSMFGIIGELTTLKSLNFWHCKCRHFPAAIVRLSNLEGLFAGNNEFTALPDEIGGLRKLKALNLGHNALADLPSSLGEIEHLEELELRETPLNSELAVAYTEGVDAVKGYLRARAGAQVVLNEAKLILVGEGEVGKSCLLGALRGDDWLENRDTTHGIEIKPVKVTDPGSGTEITLNGWDFGGQRVYRPTHQLFFSAPAVYLVVWKPREGPQQGFVKEWLKLVKHREPEAKILVVATHGGPGARQPDIDRQELWDLFGKD